jgi:uncharacterized RDD family membrane protein YckC
MSCPLCGTSYLCAHARTSTAFAPAPESSSSFSPATEARSRADQEHWRQEVISRVRQHRARRRRFDPNASMELDFPAETPLTISTALAEPPLSESVGLAEETPFHAADFARSPLTVRHDVAPNFIRNVTRPQPRKVIHFPRHVTVDLEMELAAPAPEVPRILDAPEAEQMELLPSFADIRLDEAPHEDRFQEELELPGEPAPLRQRLESGLMDAAIVAAALGVFAAPFAFTLARLDQAGPHVRPALVCALAAGATLWLLYQYLFLVFGKRTPGMIAAHLELLTFDDRQPSFIARSSRAFGATLSGLSLGLGFAWALVDEHTLGWHDRISQTYLRSADRNTG